MDLEELAEEIKRIRERCHDLANRLGVIDLRITKAETGSDICLKNIEKKLDCFDTKFVSHVYEGERQGGFRDRLLIVEKEISALKNAQWARVIVAGFIGGLLSQVTPELIGFFIRMIK